MKDNRQGVDFNLVAERVAINFRRKRNGPLRKNWQNNSHLENYWKKSRQRKMDMNLEGKLVKLILSC